MGAEDDSRVWVELSHVISDGMATYPGLPAPQFAAHLTRSDSRKLYTAGTEFTIDRVTMVGNTGTYLDSRSIATRTGATFPACRWSRWWTCLPSSSAWAEELPGKSVSSTAPAGTRMKLSYTRAMVRAALAGVLDQAAFTRDPVFGTDRVAELTSMWSDHLIERPENHMTGVSFSQVVTDEGEVTNDSTAEFLRNYMTEFHGFITRVYTALPRNS